MVLSFSTQYADHTPNLFIEKIHASVFADAYNDESFRAWNVYVQGYERKFSKKLRAHKVTPKLHTIRKDPKRRWKVGMTIQAVVYNRTRNRFEFATMVCTAIQEISISWLPFGNFGGPAVSIRVDDRELSDAEVLELVRNDGFDTYDQFEEFFKQEDFDGRLIHWTEKRY